MSTAQRPAPLSTAVPSVLSETAALDEEKALSLDDSKADTTEHPTEPASRENLDDIVAAHGTFARVTRYLAQLGVETRSTERIPEDERDQVRSSSALWARMCFRAKLCCPDSCRWRA